MALQSYSFYHDTTKLGVQILVVQGSVMSDLQGKVAVVIGASGEQNFGAGIARCLAAAGTKVVVAARREKALLALAEEIDGLAVSCDISKDDEVASLFAAARETYGRVDIAVNSAGLLAGGMIADINAEAIQPTLDVSFIGSFLFFKHAARAMTSGGSVITISSLTARIPGPGLSVYAAARAGIDYAIKVAALEYGAQNIRFNSIAAGLIKTDMTGMLFNDENIVKNHTADVPLNRLGEIDDIAQAVLWLADAKASGFVTGQLLDLAGGQQLGHLPR